MKTEIFMVLLTFTTCQALHWFVLCTNLVVEVDTINFVTHFFMRKWDHSMHILVTGFDIA